MNVQLKGDLEENKKAMLSNISNGKALDKLKQLVKNQGGDISYIEDTEKFEKAQYIIPVKSEENGIIKSLKAEEIGKISVNLGAGRIRKEDTIESNVGIVLEKKIGDAVKRGEIIAYIHANDENKAKEAVKKLEEIYVIK